MYRLRVLNKLQKASEVFLMEDEWVICVIRVKIGIQSIDLEILPGVETCPVPAVLRTGQEVPNSRERMVKEGKQV